MSPWLRMRRPTASSIAKPPATHQGDSRRENRPTTSLGEAGSHVPNTVLLIISTGTGIGERSLVPALSPNHESGATPHFAGAARDRRAIRGGASRRSFACNRSGTYVGRTAPCIAALPAKKIDSSRREVPGLGAWIIMPPPVKRPTWLRLS